MNTFALYFQLGIEHITDLIGYDHILFLIILCGVYTYKEWKSILILITAFTIGHSISLALAVLGIINIAGEIIEFLIPITILITAIGNVVQKTNSSTQIRQHTKYAFALFFGLIHGLGFSNYLKALLEKNELALPLFSFNIGIELGQLCIVLAIIGIGTVCTKKFHVRQQTWNYIISIIGIIVSSYLIIVRFP